MTDLKAQLDAAAKNWLKNADYKTINPEVVAQDLKAIFKNADSSVMTAMVTAKINEIAIDNGRTRAAGRVRAGLALAA